LDFNISDDRQDQYMDKKDETNFSVHLKNIITKVSSLTLELKNLKVELNKLSKSHENDVKKIRTAKNKKIDKKNVSGFMKTSPIPSSIADYLDIDRNSNLNRNDIHSKIYTKLKDKGLTYEKDHRVLRVGDEEKKLFNLTDNVNKITSPSDKTGFNFYNLHSYISKIFINNVNKNVLAKSNNNDKLTISNEKKSDKKGNKDKKKRPKLDKKKKKRT